MTARKLRVAWFAAVSPCDVEARSVSHYAAELLIPLLRDEFEIEVFSASYGGEYEGVPLHHYLNAFRRQREAKFDLFFYHCGDNPQERFIRMHLGLMPGVSWLHELYFVDLGAEGMHTSPWEHTVKQYLEPSLPCAHRDPPPIHVWPAAYRETALSPVVILPSTELATEFASWKHRRIEAFPGAHVTESLPLPVSSTIERSSGSTDGVFRIVARANAHRDGRGHVFLPALARLDRPWHLEWVIDPADTGRAMKLIEEFSLGDRVTLREGLSFQGWSSRVAESDCALHFAAPTSGSISPYLELSLAAGCPSVVIEQVRTGEIPDTAVFKIQPGLRETSQIAGVLEVIANSGSRELGISGREFVQRERNISMTAERLGALFRMAAPLLSGVMERWGTVQTNALKGLERDLRSIIDAPLEGVPGSFDYLVTPWLEELRRSRKPVSE